MNHPTSLNFGFLYGHDPHLTTYAARAERYVFDDPNTSLLKLRQFAELLGRHVAAFHTIDTTDNELRDVVAVIRRKRLAPREITELFDQLRLRGNEAAHDGQSGRSDTGEYRRVALAGLITAYKLAVWFQQTFIDPDFAPGPYKPPPYPRDVEEALRTELDALREDAARYEQQLAKSQGQIKELDRIRMELQQQAEEAQAASRADRTLLVVAQQAHQQEKAERVVYERRLQELQRDASFLPADTLQSFIERSQRSAQSMRLPEEDTHHLPLTQLRIIGPHESYCCQKPTLLVQSMKGGFVSANCSQCGRDRSLKWDEFLALDLWVSCPKCRIRAEAGKVDGNYGFRCPECNWRCYLASLLPMYDELIR